MKNWERGLEDLELLKRIVEHTDEILDDHAINAFECMYRKVKHGAQKRLTSRQREWAESVYDKHDLQRHYSENLVSRGDIATGSVVVYEWEKNRPLKPPGVLRREKPVEALKPNDLPADKEGSG